MPSSSRRARLILGSVGLLLSSWLAAAPLDVVRQCADTASPTLNGVQALEAVCPGLQDALAAAGFDKILIEGWRQKMNAHALAELSGLALHYSQGQRHAPDTASLSKALESLQEQAPKTSSWWQSLKIWLKNWLSHSDSTLASWLNRLLDRWSASTDVSVTFLKIVTYCLTALVVVAAVVIVVREIRAAGVGRRAQRRAGAESQNPVTPEADLELGLVAGSATDALAALLRALVRRLLQLGRLRADRSLTHRELVLRSVFESEEQRAAFAAVAFGAESNFYGPRGRTRDSSDDVKRRGEALLAQLAQLKSGS
jgi:ABC-type multidrug transport system fused ATPase/permease subunit